MRFNLFNTNLSKVHFSEVDQLVEMNIPPPNFFGNFSEFSFKPRSIDEDLTALVSCINYLLYILDYLLEIIDIVIIYLRDKIYV